MANLRMYRFLAAFFSLIFILGCTSEPAMKKENVEIARIVVKKGASPWQTLALEELTHYLKLMSGKDITVEEITASSALPGKGNIYLGDAAEQVGLIEPEDVRMLGYDGYVMVCKDGAVGISGKGAGVLYGIYKFLEEMGWLHYGPDFEIIPHGGTLPLKDMKVCKSPFFELRRLDAGYGGEFYGTKMTGFEQTRLGFSPAFISKKLSNIPFPYWGLPDFPKATEPLHTTPVLIPAEVFDSKPEFRARDKNGKELKGHICLGNQELIDILKRRVNQWMTNCDYAEFFSVAQGDGSGWCECRTCLALDPINAEKKGDCQQFLTDRLLNCVNQVAEYVEKEHPDKIVMTLAYMVATETAPLKLKPARNVRVLLCPYPAGGGHCQSHDLFCPLNAEFLKNFEDWKKIAPDQLYIFDYPMNYSKLYIPFFSHDAMVSKLRFYYKNNIKGIWYCGLPRLFGGLFCFIQGKLLWDPTMSDEDLARLEDEYLTAYYGAAAPDMKKLLGLLRKLNHDSVHPVHQGCHGNGLEFARADYIPEAYKIMDAAEKSVADDSVFAKRVRAEKYRAILWLDLDACFTQDVNERYMRLGELVRLLRRDAESGMLYGPNTGISMETWLKTKYNIDLNLKKEGLDSRTWYKAKFFDGLAACNDKSEVTKFIRKNTRKTDSQIRIKDEMNLLLGGFTHKGATFGPQKYSYLCTPSVAIGVFGGATLSCEFKLTKDEIADTNLVLDALDNDKTAKTRIRISLNGKVLFSGENQASKKDWTALKFPVKKEWLQKENTLEIVDMEEDKPNSNWFLFRKARLLPLPSSWKLINEWNFSNSESLKKIVSWCEQGSSAKISIDDKNKTPEGNDSLKVTIDKKRDKSPLSAVQVWFPSEFALKKGEHYKIRMWAMASRQQSFIAVALANTPGYPVAGKSNGIWNQIVPAAAWLPVEIDFVADIDYDKGTRVPNLSLASATGDQYWLGDVRFEKEGK